MFEITDADIALLNDVQLRELVVRLCQAEVKRLAGSTASVLWGGHQKAPDGGIDVRCVTASTPPTDGYIPRANTGFQVKKESMPPARIRTEMRPKGVLRPVIMELAELGGAYVIVTSVDSTTGPFLTNRREAMAKAVAACPHRDKLHLDFFDQSRLLSWVQDFPAVVLWVRERIGKAIPGWRPYGRWANSKDLANDEYIADDKLRITTTRDSAHREGLDPISGIQEIRKLLSTPRNVVRLVGLSGVGKTRFVQALFEEDVGGHALDRSLAIYTDTAYEPAPTPLTLAHDLISSESRNILVIDNCSSELHRQLCDVCQSSKSHLSLITIEYDITEGPPEATEVFSLAPSSDELMATLLSRRFPHISPVDAQTITRNSGGNARIAIALAGTIELGDSIATLTDDQLFQRLFRQRHEWDKSLDLAAQACSLVYPFECDPAFITDESEIGQLARLAGITTDEMYRSVAELQSRDLVQKRGVWRAVLPHAIANRMAKSALRFIPPARLAGMLVNGGSPRLFKSYSRRLGYLHDCPEAVAIVDGWLSVGGILGDVAALDEVGRAAFANVAPASPQSALSAIERWVLNLSKDEWSLQLGFWLRILRSIAYEVGFFDRCVEAIVRMVTVAAVERNSDESHLFASLFHIHFSGTLTPIEQRLSVVASLLQADDERRREFGLVALKATLNAGLFSSHYSFEFGAHRRDFGYWPASAAEVRRWYQSALQLATKIACSGGPCAEGARTLLAEQFSLIWANVGIHDELATAAKSIHENQFWTGGWIAIRQTLSRIRKSCSPAELTKLRSLEELLRPVELRQRVRSIIFASPPYGLSLDDEEGETVDEALSAYERADAEAQRLGKAVAEDPRVFADLLPEIVSSNGQLFPFGRGLAQGSSSPASTWHSMIEQLLATEEASRRTVVLRGFLYELQADRGDLVNTLLNEFLRFPALAPHYPSLQVVVATDVDGIRRLEESIANSDIPAESFRLLGYARYSDGLPAPTLSAILLGIAAKPGGIDIAIDILQTRLSSTTKQNKPVEAELKEVGRELMRRVRFSKNDQGQDYDRGMVVRTCLDGPDAAAVAREVCGNLMSAISNFETYAFDQRALLSAILSVQPIPTLDSLFAGDEADLRRGLHTIKEAGSHGQNPLDSVPPEELLGWCDEDAATRYPAIASAVTFWQKRGESGPRQWTNLAVELLRRAPDREAVLTALVDQFAPTLGWSHAISTTMKENAMLLDDLSEDPDPGFRLCVAEQKKRMEAAIAKRILHENASVNWRNERFE